MKTSLTALAQLDVSGVTLAVGLAFLPVLGLLPIDYDRVAPALAVLPAAVAFWRRRASAGASRVDVALLEALAAVALLSLAFSRHPAASAVQFANATWIVGGAIIARQLQTPAALRVVLGGILLGGALGTLWVWTAWLGSAEAGALALYAHPRLYAMHALVAFMAGLVLLVHGEARSWPRALVAGATVVVGAGVLWSGTRSAGVGVAGALLLWWCGAPGHRPRIVRTAAGLGALALALSFALATERDAARGLGVWHAWQRTAGAGDLHELSSTRDTFWSATWQAVGERPWVGHGADAYLFLQPRQDGNQPHNWVLQYLLDLGLLGALVASTLWIRQVVRPWTRAGAGASDEDGRPLRRGAAAVAFACLLAGLFDGYLYHAWALLPAAVCAGMAGGGRKTAGTRDARGGDASRTAGAARRWLGASLAVASWVLVAHTLQLWSQTRWAAPASPRHWRAEALRAFPSYVSGRLPWLAAWQPLYPAETLAYARWAAGVSDEPVPLHVFAAQRLAERGDWAGAAQELEAARAKAHVRGRAGLERMLAVVRAAQAETPATPVADAAR